MTDPTVFGFYFGLLHCHHISPSVFGCCSGFFFLFFDLCNIINTICITSGQRHSYTLQMQKYIQPYLPWVSSSSSLQLNVKWDTLAQTIKWIRATEAVKISLCIVIVLCGLVLDGETTNYGTKDSPGRSPSWTPVWELCLLSLWAFPSSALWRVSRSMTCKDFLWKGESVLEDKFSATPPGPGRVG